MIARLRILLPTIIYIPHGVRLAPFEFNYAGVRIKAYPPYKAQVTHPYELTFLPFEDLMQRLTPDADFLPQPDVLIDNRPAIPANALQLDFQKDSFDRTQGLAIDHYDPPPQTLIAATNLVIERIRAIIKSPDLEALREEHPAWIVQYLNDEGAELQQTLGLVRKRGTAHFVLSASPLFPSAWDEISHLPDDYQLPPWERLLLEANSMLPDIGPAIVLTATALETLIAECLTIAAANSILPPGLWDWITARDGDYRKEPSLEEQYSDLLKALTGRSLKEEAQLWQAFKDIKKIRNTFVHEGRLQLNSQPVTTQMCLNYLRLANSITAWIEALMPDAARRITPKQHGEITINKRIAKIPHGASVKIQGESTSN